MRKVHQFRRQPDTDSNYANIFSIWDRVFMTYTARTDLAALRYGLEGLDDSGWLLGGLRAMPFQR